MNKDEIIQSVIDTLNATDLTTKETSNRLIRLQALAAVDSAETDWAVAMMMEPFIMELDEIEADN
ncbi:MAG: hypothetical protein HN839_01045 [Candidatus Thioglobus sp.]|jgi:hypothetical protein|nr:hypothetical protein [Candidatus Thioglobus sp.]